MNYFKAILFWILLSISAQFTFAQKIKIKDNIAYVDEKPFLKVSDCGIFKEECSISNLDGKEIIFLDNLTDPRRPGTYFRAVFIGLNTTIEIKQSLKTLLEILYKNKVVGDDGTLIRDNVKILFEKYGNRISLKDSED
ncbi:hypothetical protein [Flavobacterium sp.]|jgi:hypothetical protein|uniref:hypothetical protein n=1 Tax=Flavobacterium sp. TaxID=239 RepID=UPI0037BEE9AC